jgi:hypothetical protein
MLDRLKSANDLQKLVERRSILDAVSFELSGKPLASKYLDHILPMLETYAAEGNDSCIIDMLMIHRRVQPGSPSSQDMASIVTVLKLLGFVAQLRDSPGILISWRVE